MDKKKVLLIGGHHFRISEIASLRPRKIAKYLTASGRYDVSVITIADQTKQYREIADKDEYISGYTLVPRLNSIALYGAIRKPLRLIARGVRKVFRLKKPKTKNIMFAFNLLDDTSFYRRAKKVISEEKLWDTDIIISTFRPYASHYIARYMKRKNPAVLWVAHFDDPVCNGSLTPRLFMPYLKSYAKNVCTAADMITSVSQGFLDMIDLPADVPSYVIENGYDPDDVLATERNDNKKFILSYVGTLNKKMQDMSAFFRAIRELIEAGKIDGSRIQIEYAGPNADLFTGQAEMSGLQNILLSHGFVSRDEALEIQKKCNILLVASWNMEDYSGVLTAKIYEYMMMKRPVIAIVAGNLPDSELKETIDRCSLGFCYEEACCERDYPLLKDYIHNQYRHFVESGTVQHNPVPEEISKYSYPNLVKKLEMLFTGEPLHE